MNTDVKSIHSPGVSLIILLCLTVACSFALQFLAAGIIALIHLLANPTIDTGSTASLYLLMAASTLGTFLLPPLILQYTEKSFVYFPRKKQPYDIYLLAGIVLFTFGPLMQLIGQWNAEMLLPESMKQLEDWMKGQEENMAGLIQKVVMVDSLSLLLLNILVMAVLPAIAEEFYFRGALIHIVRRWIPNNHIIIWVIAVIFSAIHLQFYGFFPRLFLGAFFGYMLLYTKNIWVPIFGHFVNNATVTILAYYYTKQGKTYAELQSYESYSIFVYLGSIILTGLIGYVFYIRSHKKESTHGERLDQSMDI